MIQIKFKHSFTFRYFAFALFIITAVFSTTAHTRAADGDLDATFGTGGKVSTDVGASFDSANNAAQQTDGKIVTVGTTRNTDTDPDNFLMVRYNTNGSLDTTFGTNGTVIIINGTGTADFGTATGIDFQADGKILVSMIKNKIFRFNQNGSSDTTFGTNGALTIPASGSVSISGYGDIKVLSNGKVLVCGSGNLSSNPFNQGFGLARLNQDGSLDATFGTGGIVRTSFTTGTTAAFTTELSIAANGKIAIGGSVNPQMSVGQPGIAVYNADGSPDTSFGNGGKVLFTGTSANFFGSLVWQADGKIISCGRRGLDSGGISGYFRRFTASGAPDTSFGTNGEVIARINNSSTPTMNDVIVQPDGKFIGFGTGYTPDGTIGLAVSRYLISGASDTTFGINGAVVTIFNTSSNLNQAQALTGFLQTDGKIVAAGAETIITPFNVNVAVARYSNSPGIVPVNNPTLRIADFDGDGKTDVSVYRQGTWYINPSSNPSFAPDAPAAAYGVQFGQANDVTVPADYDGDGKSDIAVWRGGELAYFYILNSSDNTFRAVQFGKTGDNPTVSGDWDADGKADLAVYRNGAQSFFYYRPSSQNGVDFVPIQWGTNGDTPIFGDFDGDRKLDATVYRPSNNTFYVRQSTNGILVAKQWGNSQTDAIFAGDFDGDGKSDFAVWRFSGADAGTWYVAQSGGTNSAFRWGLSTDAPVPADYDGDGKTDFAVFRRSNGTWYINQSTTGTPRYSVFGASSDLPLPLNLVR